MRSTRLEYKWVALSNTTLGMLVAMINSSILLIALPDIFRGIGVDPLKPGNTSYLLWLILGFLVVIAVLLVSLGRLGDIYGRVRMFNLGFAVFTLFSILLSITWMHGSAGALWLILMRVGQGVGGALVFANSSAILTDAFPRERARARARGQQHRHGRRLVPRARARRPARPGRLAARLPRLGSGRACSRRCGRTAACASSASARRRGSTGGATRRSPLGLVAVMVGITYGIQPYGGHTMGWTAPFVLSMLIGGDRAARGLLRDRDPRRRADVPPRPVPDPRLRCRQPRRACSPRWAAAACSSS